MTKRQGSLLGVAMVALLAASASFAGPGIGQPAPGFTLPDSAGVNRSLSDHAGKVRMVNFWASW